MAVTHKKPPARRLAAGCLYTVDRASRAAYQREQCCQGFRSPAATACQAWPYNRDKSFVRLPAYLPCCCRAQIEQRYYITMPRLQPPHWSGFQSCPGCWVTCAYTSRFLNGCLPCALCSVHFPNLHCMRVAIYVLCQTLRFNSRRCRPPASTTSAPCCHYVGYAIRCALIALHSDLLAHFPLNQGLEYHLRRFPQIVQRCSGCGRLSHTPFI